MGGEVASKPAAEEFAQLTERINTAAAKLGQFRKDTEGRKKNAQMQEAGEKMSAVETEVKKLAELVEPFTSKEEEEEKKGPNTKSSRAGTSRSICQKSYSQKQRKSWRKCREISTRLWRSAPHCWSKEEKCTWSDQV